VEVQRIIRHVMNPDQKDAVWTVQMVGDPDGVTQDVEGTFFYETPARKRIWNEYITDNFTRQQVAALKKFVGGFAGKTEARKNAAKIPTDDINITPESNHEEFEEEQ
jgi:hypothetical protein